MSDEMFSSSTEQNSGIILEETTIDTSGVIRSSKLKRKSHPNRRLEGERPNKLSKSKRNSLKSLTQKLKSIVTLKPCLKETKDCGNPIGTKKQKLYTLEKSGALHVNLTEINNEPSLTNLKNTNAKAVETDKQNKERSVSCNSDELTPKHENPERLSLFKMTDSKPETIIRTENQQNKLMRASEMWLDVMNKTQFWKVEDPYVENETYESSEVSLVNYQRMLEEFAFDLEDYLTTGRSRLEEDKFMEVLKSPQLMAEFYLTPAQVQVFTNKLKTIDSSQEGLKIVCQSRQWPEPQYFQDHKQHCRDGFFFTCKLKGKVFRNRRSASNTLLARELAALECLDWLGIYVAKSES